MQDLMQPWFLLFGHKYLITNGNKCQCSHKKSFNFFLFLRLCIMSHWTYQTPDQKVASLNPGRSSRRIFPLTCKDSIVPAYKYLNSSNKEPGGSVHQRNNCTKECSCIRMYTTFIWHFWWHDVETRRATAQTTCIQVQNIKKITHVMFLKYTPVTETKQCLNFLM